MSNSNRNMSRVMNNDHVMPVRGSIFFVTRYALSQTLPF